VRDLTDPKNKISAPSQTVATALLRGSRSKPAVASLTTFQISSKSVHFRRSYSRPREGRFWAHWVNPILAESDASLQANNKILPSRTPLYSLQPKLRTVHHLHCTPLYPLAPKVGGYIVLLTPRGCAAHEFLKHY